MVSMETLVETLVQQLSNTGPTCCGYRVNHLGNYALVTLFVASEKSLPVVS